jgi:hypothetical protein
MRKGQFLVSFMDILGFAHMIENCDIDMIYNSMYRILGMLRDFILDGEPNEKYSLYDDNGRVIRGPLPSPIYVRRILERYLTNFSDSIILYIRLIDDEQDNIERFRSLCWVSNFFISKSILTPQDRNQELALAIRCGIAHGEARVNQRRGIHIGQPIIDAYKLCERQQWMGGAIHPNVPPGYCESLVGYNNELFRYNAPIQPREDEQYDISSNYSLNWIYHHPSLRRWVRDKQREGPILRDIGGHVKRYPWEPRNHYQKGINTLNFVKTIDEEWNRIYHVTQSTEREFQFPDWYIENMRFHTSKF